MSGGKSCYFVATRAGSWRKDQGTSKTISTQACTPQLASCKSKMHERVVTASRYSLPFYVIFFLLFAVHSFAVCASHLPSMRRLFIEACTRIFAHVLHSFLVRFRHVFSIVLTTPLQLMFPAPLYQPRIIRKEKNKIFLFTFFLSFPQHHFLFFICKWAAIASEYAQRSE